MANQKVGIGHTQSDLELTLQERGSVTTASVEIVNSDGEQVNLASGLVPENFDYIDLSYDGNENLTGVVYKTGGSSGTTVAILVLTYDSSNVLQTITKI